MSSKVINIPIFGQALLVIFGSPQESVQIIVEEVPNMTEKDAKAFFPNFHCNGLFKYSQSYDCYILWMPIVPKTIREYGTMVHEIQHFVYTMLDNVGITHSGDSDELYSYLMGYVFEEIDMFVNEIKESDALEVAKEDKK